MSHAEPKPDRPSVVSVGTFDGVHLGHQDLMRRARSLADAHGARVVALSFSPHPKSLLPNQTAPVEIVPFERRAELLRAAGADEVVRLVPSAELLGESPEEFVRRHLLPLSPLAVVEGPDFRFGRKRAGDEHVLRALGEGLGFDVHIAEPIRAALKDGSDVVASSTLLRFLLENGRVEDAGTVLGRPHELAGSVVRGDRRGRTIGFPTANLEPLGAAPGDGVYACTAELPDGTHRSAAVNIGTRPTFDGFRRMIEAHLLDTEADDDGSIRGMDEYGWSVRLRFLTRVRDQVRFSSGEALVSQLHRDISRVREIAAPTTAGAHA